MAHTADDQDGAPRRAGEGAVWVAGALAGTAVAVMMLNIVIDSALRAFFNRPIAGTFDRTQFWWMVTIGFGAMGLAHRRNEHIEATVLYELMPARLRAVWTLVSSGITSILLLGLTWFGWTAARANQVRGEYSGGSGVSIWPARYWVPIGAGMFLVQLLLSVSRARRKERQQAAPRRQP